MLDPTRSTTAEQFTNPLYGELIRLDQGISGFKKKNDETDEAYAQKVQTFGQLFARFGLTLVDSQQYQNADDQTKKELFDLLNHRAKSVVTENQERIAQAFLSPAPLFQSIRERQLRERIKAKQKR